jgi:hypothetical protein
MELVLNQANSKNIVFQRFAGFFIHPVYTEPMHAWVRINTIESNFMAYFETRTGLGLGPGLGLEENPDSRKTRTRTRKKSRLVFKKTRT